MRASTAYRITYPLRRFASAIPPSVYAALRGGRLRLHLPAPRVAPVLVGDRPWALVVDDHFPEPDRDSGSIDIVNMVAALRALRLLGSVCGTTRPRGRAEQGARSSSRWGCAP